MQDERIVIRCEHYQYFATKSVIWAKNEIEDFLFFGKFLTARELCTPRLVSFFFFFPPLSSIGLGDGSSA